MSRRALLGQAVKGKTQEEKFTFVLCPEKIDRGKVLTGLHFNARICFLAELETIQSYKAIIRVQSFTVPLNEFEKAKTSF